ncbi:potassium-transporting ATPase subunit A [Pedobacter sp. BAL39]|uniref:hypothetical protein n=1 Tax=Pedobacter sp. BAL39 TaxID=391596 RepID=UPI000155AA37|nr:hypothetical protein [Pedobacter sp. BAL39]EDM34186.1 potassium-transporting ATPase subunit A [Pedobacter sp. BAL39]
MFGSCQKDQQENIGGYVPRLATATSSAYISKILEYLPAPGQFINETIGSPANVEKLVGSASVALLSLGAYGGSLTFAFDHSVENADGADLAIYGNPYEPIITNPRSRFLGEVSTEIGGAADLKVLLKSK